jgi:hypothetical protein
MSSRGRDENQSLTTASQQEDDDAGRDEKNQSAVKVLNK